MKLKAKNDHLINIQSTHIADNTVQTEIMAYGLLKKRSRYELSQFISAFDTNSVVLPKYPQWRWDEHSSYLDFPEVRTGKASSGYQPPIGHDDEIAAVGAGGTGFGHLPPATHYFDIADVGVGGTGSGSIYLPPVGYSHDVAAVGVGGTGSGYVPAVGYSHDIAAVGVGGTGSGYVPPINHGDDIAAVGVGGTGSGVFNLTPSSAAVNHIGSNTASAGVLPLSGNTGGSSASASANPVGTHNSGEDLLIEAPTSTPIVVVNDCDTTPIYGGQITAGDPNSGKQSTVDAVADQEQFTQVANLIHQHLVNEVAFSINGANTTTWAQLATSDFSHINFNAFESSNTVSASNVPLHSTQSNDLALAIDDGALTTISIANIAFTSTNHFSIALGTVNSPSISFVSSNFISSERAVSTDFTFQVDITDNALAPWLNQFLNSAQMNWVNSLTEHSFISDLDLHLALISQPTY